MTVSSASPLPRMVSAYSRCSVERAVSSSSPVMPITAFIGVRISWLMVARKSDFAALALSRSWANRCCSRRSKATIASRATTSPKLTMEASRTNA